MRPRKTNDRIRGISPEIQTAAFILRQQMTPAESHLWEALKGKQINGLRFRRQHPIGQFILDFYCPAIKLAIELDGPVHDDRQDYDQARTEAIEAYGYQVLRFTNTEVSTDRASVLKVIAKIAKSHQIEKLMQLIAPNRPPAPNTGGI
jgi:very-short-patch-repair endonuclease